MRVLYANNVHASGPFPAHYPKTKIAVPRFFELLRANPHDVDCIVIGGDLVNRGPAEIDELRWIREQLDAVGIPYHVVAGNHDIAPSRAFAERYPGMEDMEDCPLEETHFGQVFGEEGIRSVVELGPWRLVTFSIRNEDTDGQVEWLSDQLSGPGPTLVVGHYPLTPSRIGGFCHEWGYSRIGDVRARLAECLEHRSGRVRAYFCGHQHINSRMPLGCAHQVVTGALGMATCCYRVLDVHADRIEVTTHRLDGIPDWLGDAMNPDRSADAEHPSLESYHWGLERERTFEIHAESPADC